MTTPYPLFLRLEGRAVLVVGAGSVGARKIAELLDAGATVTVVATVVSPYVRALPVTVHERAFETADVEGAWLVIGATNDAAVNRAIAAAADARRVFVNAVDDPESASAFFGAVLRRPPFVVAISSSGEAPALTRLLREVLEGALPQPHWVAAARALRAEWKRDATPMADRFPMLVRRVLDGS